MYPIILTYFLRALYFRNELDVTFGHESLGYQMDEVKFMSFECTF